MPRATLLALIVFMIGGSVAARAHVVSPRELTFPQIMQLEQSEQRMVTYDRALQAVDLARKKHRISAQEFAYEEHDLTAFISGEAVYQNDIMTRKSALPEDVREVVENVERYTTLAAEAVGCIALRCLPVIADAVH